MKTTGSLHQINSHISRQIFKKSNQELIDNLKETRGHNSCSGFIFFFLLFYFILFETYKLESNADVKHVQAENNNNNNNNYHCLVY